MSVNQQQRQMETTTEKKDWKTLACLIIFGVLVLTGIFYGGYVSECERAENERHMAELAERFSKLDSLNRYALNETTEDRILYELREINRKL